MTWLIAKFGPAIGRVLFWAFVVALIALVLLGAKCASDRSLKGEVVLSKNQTQAAQQSGSDAVQTVGAQQASETSSEALTQENSRDIHSAPGADAHVNSGVRDTGFSSLCKRTAYIHDPKCVQFAPPK